MGFNIDNHNDDFRLCECKIELGKLLGAKDGEDVPYIVLRDLSTRERAMYAKVISTGENDGERNKNATEWLCNNFSDLIVEHNFEDRSGKLEAHKVASLLIEKKEIYDAIMGDFLKMVFPSPAKQTAGRSLR